VIICTKCGRRNADNDEFCGKCGEFLEFVGQRVAEPVPSGSGTTASDQKPDMKARQPDEAPVGTWTPTKPEPPVVDRRTAEQGRFCSRCGWGNDVSRNFCRHCGDPLELVRRERIPWWRRLLPRRSPPAAGERPHIRGSEASLGSLLTRFMATLLAVLLAGGLLAYAAAPSFRTQVNNRLDQGITAGRGLLLNPGYVEVHPVATVASSSFPGHPAQLVDNLVAPNDYWAADTARDPHPTLQFNFDGKTNLDVLEITTGTGAGPDFTRLARPRTVQITYSDGTGQLLTLNDDAKATPYNVFARGVTSMTMKITSVYPVAGNTVVALDEVEFLRQK
jgi:ribosomal protein L40E